MIIEYSTGKAELCFVKVDNDAFDFNVFDGNELFFKSTMNGAFSKVNPFYRTLPEGNWQIVGNPFELAQEVIKDLVPEMRDSGFPFDVQEITDTWKDILDKWRIYQTNPLGKEPIRSNYSSWPEHLIDYGRWGYNQERTGSFILLKKIV